MRTMLLIAAVLASTACQGTTDLDQRWAVPENISYAPELNVDLSQMHRTSSGLYIQDIEVGEGRAAAAGDSVFVHYHGWLPDGTLFDSSHSRGRPYGFMLGVGAVIRGWDEGLVGMQPGGRRRLVVRPSLGYGSKPAGAIPPLSTLVFDIEMVNVRR